MRGCRERVVSLRLLTDAARRNKIRLFVSFIDFSKAYDLVPRHKLFNILKKSECDGVMLAALAAMYRVLGTVVLTATRGVRQGLSSSCFIFIFVNKLIKLIKNVYQPEPFFVWGHIYMLMDDTVLLSSAREGIAKKFADLVDYCKEYGVKVNCAKTFFCCCYCSEW